MFGYYLLIAASCFLGQMSYALLRRMKASLYGQVLLQDHERSGVWSYAGIAAMLAGWSVMVHGLMTIPWWHVGLLWLVPGIIGDRVARFVLPMEALAFTDKFTSLGGLAIAAAVWLMF